MADETFLKVCDDDEKITLTPKDDIFETSSDISWGKKDAITYPDLQKRVEPWLTALFEAEHLSLLAGSGLTTAVSSLAGASATDMAPEPFKKYNDKILAAKKFSAEKIGRGEGNLEDGLRIANELVQGLKILGKNDDAQALETDIQEKMHSFAESILSTENGIVAADEDRRENAFNQLVSFLMSFANRTGTRDRTSIFTTNYDRLIEVGSEIAGMHLLDRFVGSIMPIFRSSRMDLDLHYNPPGMRGEPRYVEGVVRFSKLHGSVDWIQTGDDIRRIGLPFGAENITPYLDVPGLNAVTAYDLMVYPNAAKDEETANYPYVDLFRDFAASICRPNSTLVTYGYSFGDDHINRVIRDMLTIPSTQLVIISYSDPLGRIMSEYEESAHKSQISLLVGSKLADLENLTRYFLPKTNVDETTFRMSDLLRKRMAPSTKTEDLDKWGNTSIVSISKTRE